jgi:uncharacterized protein (DUF1330 family)
MPAYAIGHFRKIAMGPPIVEYLERIDATLAPFGGRFLVHGAQPAVKEGEFPSHIVIIQFPDRAKAEAWYASPAYRAILLLRTENAEGPVIIVDGVSDRHRATDILAT